MRASLPQSLLSPLSSIHYKPIKERGPIRIGCDIIHSEQRKMSPKGMAGKAFRHLTPPMCYDTIKALMKADLY
ncbi:MAG: hypothetical protein ACE5GD_09100 [Candidatus Geothermarchaeales archaeon]